MTITQLPPYSEGIKNVPKSFIREILKVSSRPEMISFAGGLPNPKFFPVEKLAIAADRVLSKEGSAALQYWITEGYLPLRDYIAQWQSAKSGINIHAEDILMLNGSQQGLDLVGKLFLNKSSPLLLEGPSYLGAIQAFSLYQPAFHHINIQNGGPDPSEFDHSVQRFKPVLFYCVPNFQNPTGNTYDQLRREQLANAMLGNQTICVEDDPYGEIYFEKEDKKCFFSLIPHQTIYLGSFSKIVSPGMRMGWAMGPPKVIRKMAVAKQAADLHSNGLAQRIIYQFLMDNPLEDHLDSIRKFYAQQSRHMMACINEYVPEATCINPKGGMFIWMTLPAGLKSTALLERAIQENVLFVPGEHFYVCGTQGKDSMRLNFSNPSREEITKGMKILARLINAR